MAKLSNIVEIIIKAKDNASKEFQKISWRMKTFASDIQATSAIAFAAVSVWIFNATKAASDLEETTQKFGVTFSNVIWKARKNSEELASWFWIADEEAMNLLSWTWDLLTWFWFTQDKALELSTTVQKLAADLASFNNTQWGAAAASKALTAWLLWEREQMKSLFISIREADIKQELLRQGKEKLKWMTLLQAKAEITLQLAMKQSKNAIWDMNRSKESLANQTKFVTAEFKNLVAEFWKGFIPIAKEAIKIILPLMKQFAEWIKNNSELATKIALLTVWVLGLWIVLAPLITTISGLITIWGSLIPILKWIAIGFRLITVAMAANPVWAIVVWIILLLTTLYKFREEIWNFMKWIDDFFDKLTVKFPILWRIWKVLFNVLFPVFSLIKLILKWFDLIFGEKHTLDVEVNKTWNLNQSALKWPWIWVNNWTAWWDVSINLWGVTVNNEADEDRLVEKIKNSFIREKQFANAGVVM